jgi:hypothetical protein
MPSTPGLGGALGRRPDFTSRAAVYAIRTYGGQGGGPRKGSPYPNVDYLYHGLTGHLVLAFVIVPSRAILRILS